MRSLRVFPRDYGKIYACVLCVLIVRLAHMDGCPSGLRRRS